MNKKILRSIRSGAFIFAILSFNFAAKAQNSECKDKLVAFEEFVLKNSHDQTIYKRWKELKLQCPTESETVYLLGEKILSQKVDQANTAEEKSPLISELSNLYDEHDKAFPNNKRGNRINKALLLYNNKAGDSREIFTFLDKAFQLDNSEFTNPEVLNLYSGLLVSQNEKKEIELTLDQLLEKLDQISGKVQSELKKSNQVKDNLTIKSQTAKLTAEEQNSLQQSKLSISELTIVTENVNARIDKLTNCEVLISFYQKNFDKNSENALWLERVSDRLDAKKCKSDFFIKVTEKLYALSPTAKSAYAMGMIARDKKDRSQVIEYFTKSAELQTDVNKKAELYYLIATTYGYPDKEKAREFAKKALAVKPDFGKSYIYISQLYSNSTRDCAGSNAFEDKALYWLAAETAKKAGAVDPTMKKTADQLAADFIKQAPSKQEISMAKRKAGEQIAFKCWIGESVSIPKL
ncbi:tetratricopeptide repeat protein [Flavobacterium microcysteis]